MLFFHFNLFLYLFIKNFFKKIIKIERDSNIENWIRLIEYKLIVTIKIWLFEKKISLINFSFNKNRLGEQFT